MVLPGKHRTSTRGSRQSTKAINMSRTNNDYSKSLTGTTKSSHKKQIAIATGPSNNHEDLNSPNCFHSTTQFHQSSSSAVSSVIQPVSNVVRSETQSSTFGMSSLQHVSTPPPNNTIKRGKAANSPGKLGKVGPKQDQIISSLGFGGPKITPELYTQQFPGALPLNSEIFCWYLPRQVWFSATVIHARFKKLASQPISSRCSSVSGGLSNRGHGKVPAGGKKPVDEKTAPTSSALTSGEKLIPLVNSLHSNFLTPQAAEGAVIITPFEWDGGEGEYDYYVHFHGEDRRFDMWVVASLLRPADFDFHSDEPCVRKPPGPDEVHRLMDAEYLREHEENTKLKTIGNIQIGEFLVETWYFSPYPKEFQNLDVLYICEYCLNFFKFECELISHSQLCSIRHPPGDEIYRDTVRNISVFEVDGSLSRQYAENVCFLSKLFLDHKTLRHSVYLFLFYIVTERTKEGHRIVGYFSKEKYSKNNLSCIMCLPQHQRKGYGRFLINLSYALSRKEGKRGTPERPLSDLGKATYIKYWAQTSVASLLSLVNSDTISIEQIAQETSIESGDIAMALEAVGILRYSEGIPYLFLPNGCIQAASKWCKAAFINQVVPPITNLSPSELGLNYDLPVTSKKMSLDGDVSLGKCHKLGIVKAETLCSSSKTIGKKVPERQSKRRRATIGWGDNWELDFDGPAKKIKTSGNLNELTSIGLGLPLVKDSESKPTEIIPIAPINLQNLRWESYDLHLGPYEYAPIVT